MLSVSYLPVFVRQLKKLEQSLQEEVLEKIELFKNSKNHNILKVHKLRGALKGRYSFSVNYRYRIVFVYIDKKKTSVALLAFGDHNVYSPAKNF